jgi:peptidoglycan/LPS O-acetylase OafA/YrhL
MVLIGHLLAQYDIYNPIENQFVVQNFGVVLFFIISGFLIVMSVDNKKDVSNYGFKSFVIERFSRIYSAYIPALFLIFIIDLAGSYFFNYNEYNSSITFENLIGNLFMFQDFPLVDFLKNKFNISLNITSFGSSRQLWTVAIEWWLYLFFGFIMFKKIKLNSLIPLLFLLVPLLINTGGRGNGLTLIWFLGGAVYYILKNKTFRVSGGLTFFIILILTFFQRGRFISWEIYDCGIYIIVASILYLILYYFQYLCKIEIIKSNIINFINVISDYSFSLYLLHYSLMIFIFKFSIRMNKNVEFFVVFIFLNLISWFFSSLTEKHHKKISFKLKSALS